MVNSKTKKLSRLNISLIVAITLISAAMLTFVVLYSVSMSNQNQLQTDLENIYQKNFIELVDNVNNTDLKLDKVTSSDYSLYSQTLLNEISKNTTQAANNLAELPVSVNGIEDTISFINEISGFTQTLANKLENASLSAEDIQTLEDIKQAISELKVKLNEMATEIYNGNIFFESRQIDGDFNNFTLRLQNLKSGDVEYPAMIYDGPFSQSTLNKEIKNLKESEVSKDFALEKIKSVYKNLDASFDYLGETNGLFTTYDFKIDNNNQVLYAQITKNGGKILTISGMLGTEDVKIEASEGVEIAKQFATSCGITNTQSVWYDVIASDIYVNLAPVQNDVILYPDLVKVKVDLSTGLVVGYEASAYYTNHIQRNLNAVSVSSQTANAKVNSSFQVLSTNLVVAPLEYNREVLCWEMKANKDGATYYFYVDANSGELVNILKVVETEDGNLLM